MPDQEVEWAEQVQEATRLRLAEARERLTERQAETAPATAGPRTDHQRHALNGVTNPNCPTCRESATDNTLARWRRHTGGIIQ